MKKNKIIISYFFGFISCLIVTTVSATILYNAKDIEFTPSDESWTGNNMQDAVNDIKDNYIPKSEFLGRVWEFDYTGGEQTFSIPITGTYKIELWGAQGGAAYAYNSSEYLGGYGGYSVGEIQWEKNQMVYINVGGQGNNMVYACSEVVKGNGYNGGTNTSCQGYALYGTNYSNYLYAGGGGGATHIATTSGLLSTLENKKDSILIVSGGGGAATSAGSTYYANHSAVGGNAGGLIGNQGGYSGAYNLASDVGIGGTQTTSGTSGNRGGASVKQEASFGQGCIADKDNFSGGHLKVSGGGGYYGGGCGNHSGGGAGSSYIGNISLTNKAMYCYNCKTSDIEDTKTISNTCVSEEPVEQCSKKGHGYAKITLVSLD